jgi:hypothetical protein
MQRTTMKYQHLLNKPPMVDQCQTIANELADNTLEMCSDGAFEKASGISSHGWVCASSLLETKIATGN